MAVTMPSLQQSVFRVAAGAPRRTPSTRATVVVRAAQDKQQSERLSFAQVAMKSMIAVTAAASLTAAPLPAMAGDVFTYGRPQIIAERERLFEEAQAKAVAAMEELAAARAKVASTVSNTVAQVVPAPTRTEVSAPAAGSAEPSAVPSAVPPEPEAPSAASILGDAVASFSDLVGKAVQ